MRRLIVPAIVAAVFASSSAAFASEAATGTVKTFDAKQMTLTLSDGTVYHLRAGLKDPGIHEGSKVSITYDMLDGVNTASDITLQ